MHSWAVNAVLMTFEAKKSINLNTKLVFPNLHALKINKQYSEMTTTASGVYTETQQFSVPILFDF